jgi:hypothetical protein
MVYSEPIEDDRTTVISTNADSDAVLEEFKAGLVRSMRQHNAGLVKTFDDVDDFLDDLHSLE